MTLPTIPPQARHLLAYRGPQLRAMIRRCSDTGMLAEAIRVERASQRPRAAVLLALAERLEALGAPVEEQALPVEEQALPVEEQALLMPPALICPGAATRPATPPPPPKGWSWLGGVVD